MKINCFFKKMKHLAIFLLAMLPAILFAEVLGSDEGNPQQFGGGTFSGNIPGAPTGAATQRVVAQSAQGGTQQQSGGGAAAAAKGAAGKGNIGGNVSAVDKILNPDKQKKELAAAAQEPPEPQDNSITRGLIMDISINAYPDKCACPYSRNSDGFECGVESAYYKPGGWRIYCYPQDVRGQQNIFYRKTH